MSSINRYNYQEFFLQYMEETLPQDLLGELLVFVEQNPDLREEFEDLNLVVLDGGDEIAFPEKSLLKQYSGNEKVDANNIDYFSIALIEGDLSENDTAIAESKIKSVPALNQVYNIYKRTKIEPEHSVICPRKNELKHNHVHKMTSWYYYVSGAASVLFILGLFFLLPKQKLNKPDVAEINRKENKALLHKEAPVKGNHTAVSIKVELQSQKETVKRELKKLRIDTKSAPSIPTTSRLVDVDAPEVAMEEKKNPGSDSENKDTQVVFASKNEPIYTLITSEPTKSEPHYITASEILERQVGKLIGEVPVKNIVRPTQKAARIWEIVSLGTNALSRLTQNKFGMYKKYDEQGNRAALTFKAGTYQYAKKIN